MVHVGNLFLPFLISYKILVEASKGFSHLLNGPSANDLMAQAFAGVYYLVFLRACVSRCLIYYFSCLLSLSVIFCLMLIAVNQMSLDSTYICISQSLE